MERVLCILLVLIGITACNKSHNSENQYIKFSKEVADPGHQLHYDAPLIISSKEVDLPLPKDIQDDILEQQKAGKISKEEIRNLKKIVLRDLYVRLVTDEKSYDLLYEFISNNKGLFLNTVQNPGCTVLIDNRNRYLPARNFDKFSKELDSLLTTNNGDKRVIEEIKKQFSFPGE